MDEISNIPQLPQRRTDTHKGDFGRILIVGGSRGMIGAPALAGLAALRSGAGLVTMAVPQSILAPAVVLNPCGIGFPLPEDSEGSISREAVQKLLDGIDSNDVSVVGCGLAQSSDLAAIIESILQTCEKPCVIDADGLNNLSSFANEDFKLQSNTILTPHPGEMNRLWNAWFREPLPAERKDQAAKLAERSGAVVVLKGAGTVVSDSQKVYVNQTGNPGMATAGSGDVLSGCIGALLGQGLSPFDAAVLGVWAHGRAGDLAAEKSGQIGVIASDLPDHLGRILSN
jgi:NAD(P)H-hydrate epimerase